MARHHGKRTNGHILNAADYQRLTLDEEHALAVLDDYAVALGGFTRHIRDARGQNLEGVPDVLLWVPAHDRDHILFAALELKLRDDVVSFMQHRVLDHTRRIDRIVAEVVRMGAPPRDGEVDLDTVFARLDAARGWT